MDKFPTKYYVYILYSESIDRYYTGVTYSPELRLSRHLLKLSRFTKQADDWKLVKTFEFSTRSEAMQYERKIKSMKSRNYIEQISAFAKGETTSG